jgi:hypothetical protein
MCAGELLAAVYGSHCASLPVLARGFLPKPLQLSDLDRTISNRRYPFAGNLSKETLDFLVFCLPSLTRFQFQILFILI